MKALLHHADHTTSTADVARFPHEPLILQDGGKLFAVADPGFMSFDGVDQYMDYFEAAPFVAAAGEETI